MKPTLVASDEPNNELPAEPAQSVDLVYEQTIRSVDSQHDNIKAIDTKAGFILTAATVLIGFRGFAIHGTIATPWLFPASLAYLFVVICALQAYRLRTYKSETLAPGVLKEYLFDDPEYTKRQFAATLRVSHKKNRKRINRKSIWLMRAEYGLITEVALLVAGSLLGSEWHSIAVSLSWVMRWM